MYIDRNSLQWKDPEIISTIMKHVDGTPATINGKEIPSTEQPDPTPVDPDPTPVDPDPTPVDPDPTPVDPDPQPVDPTPVSGALKAEYTINNWGSGYQVLIKVKNDSASRVDGWTLKISKSEVKIDSSWCVNIAEEGGYYVITPMSWNSSLEPSASVDFGIQGSGSIGTSVNISVQ
jgi:cellulase/cellobiase CelA1